MEIIIGNTKKHCPNCMKFMEPTVFADPDLDPKELGNPWKCEYCGCLSGVKDGTTYVEHIKLIQQKLNSHKETESN